MVFSTLDIIVMSLVIIMSIKGYINGFLREFFGLIGLIGGIFVASRASTWIAKYIDANVYHISNFAALKLIAFVLVLAIVWGLVSFIGAFFSDMPGDNKSIANKLFGILTAGLKYFFIFALVVSALFKNPMIKNNMKKKIKSSQLYPVLDNVGSIIIDRVPMSDKSMKRLKG